MSMPVFRPSWDQQSRPSKHETAGRSGRAFPGRRFESWAHSPLTSRLVFLAVFGLILFANESLFSVVLAAWQTVMAVLETALSSPVEDASLTVLLPGAPT